MRNADVAELAGLHGAAADGAGGSTRERDSRETRFSCNMLMARGGGADGDDAWRCMSCEDPCDYEAISQQCWVF